MKLSALGRASLKTILLLVAMMSLGSLRMVEATRSNAFDARPAIPYLTGKLTVSGHVMVDSRDAQSGMTVESGSSVETGPDADAMIDLGELGSLHLRPNTLVRLSLSQNNCQVMVERCGTITQRVPPGVAGQVKIKDAKLVQVAVTEGDVVIDREIKDKGKTKKVSQKARSEKKYYDVKEVNSSGSSAFTVQCCQCCFVEKTRPRS